MPIYRFNHYQLDTSSYQLTCSGKSIEVEPKVFDLLRYLIEHHDRLVSREELFESLWPRQVVSDTSLSNQIKAARKAIGDELARLAVAYFHCAKRRARSFYLGT